MSYYVLGPGGAKTGPADLDRLRELAAQGALGADTLLESVQTGAKLPARGVLSELGPGSSPNTAPDPANAPPVSAYGGESYIPPSVGSSAGGPGDLYIKGADAGMFRIGLICAAVGALGGVVTIRFALAPLYGLYCGIRLALKTPGKGMVVVGANVVALGAVVYARMYFGRWG